MIHGIRFNEKCNKCNKCHLRFEDQAALDEHKDTDHSVASTSDVPEVKQEQQEDEEMSLECKICFRSFENIRSLRFHKTMLHKGKLRHNCKHCSLRFERRDALWNHLREVHSARASQERDPNETEGFSCEICGKTYDTFRVLHIHKAVAHKGHKGKATQGITSFRCTLCGQKFASSTSLKMHKSRSHQIKCNYRCKLCAYRFETAKELRHHELDVHGKQHCDICFKTFDTAFQLKMHKIREHGIEMSHRCRVCSVKFETAESCREHEVECHSAVPDFKSPGSQASSSNSSVPNITCSICDARVSSFAGLKIHKILKHKQQLSFRCQSCPQNFASEADLEQHEEYFRSQESTPLTSPVSKTLKSPQPSPKEAFLTCQLCKKTFQALKGLAGHEVVVHNVRYQYRCTKCGFGAMQSSDLVEHKETCSKDTSESRIGKLKTSYYMTCRICKVSFDSLEQIVEHEIRLHGVRYIHRCKICGKGYNSKHGIEYHEEKHKSGTLATSKQTPPSPSTSRSPKAIQHKSPQAMVSRLKQAYQCGQCDDSFPTEKLLTMHTSTHRFQSVGKIFRCQVSCKQMFVFHLSNRY